MQKLQFLLLDAGPIIKLFELGIWDEFTQRYDITIARTVVNEAKYTPDGSQHIDLVPYESKDLIRIIDADLSVVKSFERQFDEQYKVHPGEKETLAFLCDSSENWLLCSADGAVFRVLSLLGKADQGVSLEEALDKIGLSKKLEWQYTKKFRENYTRLGQIDFLQDRGLKKKS